MINSVFSDILNRVRDDEEWTASGRLFQTEVAAAEKALAPMVAGLVREMTSAVDDEQRSADIRDPLQLSRQLL